MPDPVMFPMRDNGPIAPRPSKTMLLAVPLKMLRIRTEAGILVEVQWVFVEGRKEAAVGGGFFEPVDPNVDDEVVSCRKHRPESGVEHPVRVGCERKTVARIIVCAHGMLVDVGGLDDVAFRCV